MDLNLRMAMLILAGLIIVAVVFDAIRSKIRTKRDNRVEEYDDTVDDGVVRATTAEPVSMEAQTNRQVEKPANNIIMISLHAAEGMSFCDYSFVQTLGSVGLSYGARKIFHYQRVNENGSECLFSAANLTKPGTFNLDQIDAMDCKGLLMFLDVGQVSDPAYALDVMVEAAYQLAEDLDATMCEGYDTPWQEDTEEYLMAQLQAVTHGSTARESATSV